MQSIQELGDSVGGWVLILIIIGFLGVHLFGWGNWFTNGKSTWYETGFFGKIFIWGIVLSLIYIFGGSGTFGTIVLLAIAYFIFVK